MKKSFIFLCAFLFSFALSYSQDTVLINDNPFPSIGSYDVEQWNRTFYAESNIKFNSGKIEIDQCGSDREIRKILSPRIYLYAGVTYTFEAGWNGLKTNDSLACNITKYGDISHPIVKGIDTIKGDGILTSTFTVAEDDYYYLQLETTTHQKYQSSFINYFTLSANIENYDTIAYTPPLDSAFSLIDSIKSSDWDATGTLLEPSQNIEINFERYDYAYKKEAITFFPGINYYLDITLFSNDLGSADSLDIYLSSTPNKSGKEVTLIKDHIRSTYLKHFTVSEEKTYYLFIDKTTNTDPYGKELELSKFKLFADSIVVAVPDTTIIDSISASNGWSISGTGTLSKDFLEFQALAAAYSNKILLFPDIEYNLQYDFVRNHNADSIGIYLTKLRTKGSKVDTINYRNTSGTYLDKFTVSEKGWYHIAHIIETNKAQYSNSEFSNYSLKCDSTQYHDSLYADVTAPTVSFSPDASVTNAELDTKIKIAFDEAVYGYDFIDITNPSQFVKLRETDETGADVPSTVTINTSYDTITIEPSALLNETSIYYISVDSLTDIYGNKISKQTSTFTTKTLVTAPEVSYNFPAADAVGIPKDTIIEIAFNKTVDSVDFSGITINNGASIEAITWFDTEDSLAIQLGNTSSSTTYTLTIPSGTVENVDAIPNNLFTLSFTTKNYVGLGITNNAEEKIYISNNALVIENCNGKTLIASDILGKIIYQSKINSNSETIQLNHNGIIIIKVGKKTIKLVN